MHGLVSELALRANSERPRGLQECRGSVSTLSTGIQLLTRSRIALATSVNSPGVKKIAQNGLQHPM
jgi:hypothetical protein